MREYTLSEIMNNGSKEKESLKGILKRKETIDFLLGKIARDTRGAFNPIIAVELVTGLVKHLE